ncbi:putative Flagellar biosynthesis regulator FlhF (GTP-binding signal recognition particle SRP54 G-domain protein) [Syntrophobacter sp. SbD1]|nr:putative Flagellar biosynthesis regulator FlhF (GTP-binding signal recognition particle SRP54 G-domain protein) [Syntrophobacter sp. SbD1]
MQVKTFKASTMEKALAQVKKDLGPDAIILSSRKAPAGSGESGFEVSAAREAQSDSAPANPSNGDASADMQNDIQEIRSFLSLLISSKDQLAQLQADQPLAELYHSLLVRGLDEKQVFILLSKAVSDLNGDTVDKRLIFNAFCKRLIAKIGCARPFRGISNSSGPTVFTFLGPTGVGKTTTLAKLAAYLKIKRQLELGIISLDTYRIGAVEQLQTYAGILEIPFNSAQSQTELTRALDDFRHCDAVLVDTTGRNYLNRDHVRRLDSLFDSVRKPVHFLVLSATAKDEDLKRTITHFKQIEINSLIFTKLDETVHHGCILNQLLRFNYPISYMGTGQRVPEDIEQATQKRLLSLLIPAGNQTA